MLQRIKIVYFIIYVAWVIVDFIIRSTWVYFKESEDFAYIESIISVVSLLCFVAVHFYLYCTGRAVIKKFKLIGFFTSNWPFYAANFIILLDMLTYASPVLKKVLIFLLNTGQIGGCSQQMKTIVMVAEVYFTIVYYLLYKLVFIAFIVFMAKMLD